MPTPFRVVPLLALVPLLAPILGPAPGLAGALHAQVIPQPGSPIRVLRVEGPRWEGRYLDRSPTHLLAESREGPAEWALEEIRELQVGVGPHRPVAASIGRTSAILAIGLALVGALTESECEGWCYGPQTRAEGFATGAMGGALLGVPVGFLLGLIPREKWVEGALP
jgi:hypothetical protein